MADNAELESFRREWHEEVARRSKPRATALSVAAAPPSSRFPPTHHEASHRKVLEEEGAPPASFDPEELAQQVGQLSVEAEHDPEEDGFIRGAIHEPTSALEHFERAVEKEATGNLGDSLQHYRNAYRLDASVDKTYRNKHYAHIWKKPAQPAPDAPDGVSVTAPSLPAETIPTPELIASFAHLPIPPAESPVENEPPLPCPISKLPSEVIIEVLQHVALRDPATFGRLALTCKRFAYHFAHEQGIWRRICQTSEFGFKGMQYTYACDILGNPTYTLGPRYTLFPEYMPSKISRPFTSWSQVFQAHPRIRFTGIYISTVNYQRPGVASAFSNTSWTSPIHIVTYYRYLRFYPDGSVVSLLSTTEPVDVVPHISKENLMTARTPAHRQHQQRKASDHGQTLSGSTDPMPPIAMNALEHVLRGRWRLTPPEPLPEDSDEGGKPEGPNQAEVPTDPRDVVIETEGVDPKYVYTMHLSLRSTSASKSRANPSKNTKLVWRGFWSYNKITDDWAEFSLRNDRAYVFRRVRGWGLD